MFPSTGKVGKVDDFLLGVRRDPTGKKPPTIFKGNRNPDGSPKYETLTSDVLGRLEKNRQDVADSELADILKGNGEWVKFWREFDTKEEPHSWLVWPNSKKKGWCDPITGII